MKRRLWFSLIATVVAVIAALAGNIATGNAPILGLDLQGGLSVILAPEEGATGDDLLVVRDLVRSSLERSGVAEPDVRVQGSNIVVDLPGVKDKEEALRSVSVSGIVELRPVVNFSDCAASQAPTVSTDETIAEGRVLGSDGTITVDEDAVTPNVEEEGAAFLNSEAKTSFRRSAPDPDAPADDTEPADQAPVDLTPTLLPAIAGSEFLPTLDGGALCAGPSQASGEVFERDSASVQLGQFGQFSVSVDLRSDGEDAWNALATQCFNRLPSCPSTGVDTDGTARPGQIAIVLDGIVQSAPVVNVPVFDGSVSITGSFTQEEAEQLSDVLNRGAFPVQVTPQETRTVSASAGSDSLRAAIIAGLIGLALVLTFLVAYYRWLALVIIGGLTVWAMAVYSAAAFVSGATNYALSLAGVTGIIVAIGVTVDSYVVFFERMKDEIRNGRTLRNAAPRSFNSTWRTIWSADLVSIIGALILFSLSVGSVRGFALYLGITTLCDLFVCFFFTRPAVLLIARSKFMVGKRAFGLEVASS